MVAGFLKELPEPGDRVQGGLSTALSVFGVDFSTAVDRVGENSLSEAVDCAGPKDATAGQHLGGPAAPAHRDNLGRKSY